MTVDGILTIWQHAGHSSGDNRRIPMQALLDILDGKNFHSPGHIFCVTANRKPPGWNDELTRRFNHTFEFGVAEKGQLSAVFKQFFSPTTRQELRGPDLPEKHRPIEDLAYEFAEVVSAFGAPMSRVSSFLQRHLSDPEEAVARVNRRELGVDD